MSSQQSWTSWLLGSYASTATPNPTEASNDDSSKPSSTSPQSPNTAASSSPYGPYVRTGRGGAGNFTWQNQAPAQNASDNLEAQNPSTLSERRRAAANIEHADTGAAIQAKAAQEPASQYVRVGRGYVPSNEVQLPHSADAPVPSPITPKVTTSLVAHPGRGGAGNHAAAAELNKQAEDERLEKARRQAEERREKIEEEIQNAVPAPPDAWLGGRRRSVDPPERPV